MMYKNSGLNIGFDPLVVEASVYQNIFTNNKLSVKYYTDPVYTKPFPDATPANSNSYIFTPTDFVFSKNPLTNYQKHANFTCRFRSKDGLRVVYTKASMTTYPLDPSPNAVPNHIVCKSPDWVLQNGVPEE